MLAAGFEDGGKDRETRGAGELQKQKKARTWLPTHTTLLTKP